MCGVPCEQRLKFVLPSCAGPDLTSLSSLLLLPAPLLLLPSTQYTVARHLIQLHVSGAFPLSPPELQQLQGLLAGSSHQTYDIFSMGHILYQMTTGVWTYADVDWCDGDSHACDSRQLLDMRPLGWQLAPAAWQVRCKGVFRVCWARCVAIGLPLHTLGVPMSSPLYCMQAYWCAAVVDAHGTPPSALILHHPLWGVCGRSGI